MNAKDGKPMDYKVLDSKVLIAVKEGWTLGEWRCAIGAVPGNNHDKEVHRVLAYGTPQPYTVAKFFFPEWDKKYNNYTT